MQIFKFCVRGGGIYRNMLLSKMNIVYNNNKIIDLEFD